MKKISTTAQWTTPFLVVSVTVWWVASSITAAISKRFLRDENTPRPSKTSWLVLLSDVQWIELSALQHVVGAVASVIFLKLYLKKAVLPAEFSRKTVLIASFCNVVGNMATNAVYSLADSSMTQVIYFCEPLFMFGLCLLIYRDKKELLIYRDKKELNINTLLVIVVMVISTILVVNFGSVLSITGIIAALLFDIASPIRNIYLKKLSDTQSWETSFQKYAAMSTCSSLICTPVIIKMLVFQSLEVFTKWQHGFTSILFHFVDNFVSINVLQSLSPLIYTIFNLMKHGVVIIINTLYYQLPMSWKMLFGVVAASMGLYLYLFKKKYPSSKLLVLAVLALGFVFFMPDRSHPIIVPVHVGIKGIETGGARIRVRNLEIFPVTVSTLLPTNVIRSSWVYDRPLSKQILSNLQQLSKTSPVHIYCGTSHCIQTINSLSNNAITTEFLFLQKVFRGTPMQDWLAKHALYKVLIQQDYESHLQELVKLAILWKYGGVYIEPNIQVDGSEINTLSPCSSEPYIVKPHANASIRYFDLACFPIKNSFIAYLSRMIVDQYSVLIQQQQLAANLYRQITLGQVNLDQTRLLHINITTLEYKKLSLATDPDWNHHYGTLSYVHRETTMQRVNIGDEIQSFPAVQFLPFSDSFVKRDKLGESKDDRSILTFFNAWWGSSFANWPPPPNIDPMLLSIHIGNDMQYLWRKNKDYLEDKMPIGCRDAATCDFLLKMDVSAYFSGCMTLMIQSKWNFTRSHKIIMVDVPQKYYNMLPANIQKNIVTLTHDSTMYGISENAKFIKGFEMIEHYAKAKLVITQRIHTALPCVAMGTPVIFLHTDNLPGGGGNPNPNKESPRTKGLLELFHTVDGFKIGKDNIQKWFEKFPWNDIPPNPNMATIMRLRTNLWSVIRQRPPLLDAGRKFGVVPMFPPSPCVSDIKIHVEFSSPDYQFTWQDHRSIESIFRLHPCASVFVHSNTVNDGRFNVFRESGYKINIMTYKDDTLRRKLDYRAFVLNKWGGIFMTSNIIVTQSFLELPKNFLVWADSSKTKVDTAFMGLEKGTDYLQQLLSENLSSPVFDLLVNASFARGDTSIFESDKVFVFDKSRIQHQCYELDSGSEYSTLKKTISKSAVAVALSSDYLITKSIGITPLKSQTLCQELLHNSCVICSKLL